MPVVLSCFNGSPASVPIVSHESKADAGEYSVTAARKGRMMRAGMLGEGRGGVHRVCKLAIYETAILLTLSSHHY